MSNETYEPTKQTFIRLIVECFHVDSRRADTMASRSISRSKDHSVENNDLFRTCRWLLKNKERWSEILSHKDLAKQISKSTEIPIPLIHRFIRMGIILPSHLLPHSRGGGAPPIERAVVKEVVKLKPLKTVYGFMSQLEGIESSIPAGGEHTGLLNKFHQLKATAEILLKEEIEEIEHRLEA